MSKKNKSAVAPIANFFNPEVLLNPKLAPKAEKLYRELVERTGKIASHAKDKKEAEKAKAKADKAIKHADEKTAKHTTMIEAIKIRMGNLR
jgi:hypothetical protein